ncbi:hypothetical protein [Halobacteriovorax sp. ZH4_bin.1]|uniref:hypothetical protein n=1 Tax=unclassified Halobacteriovorax TaxID=2639665 RepID=UPI00371D014C
MKKVNDELKFFHHDYASFRDWLCLDIQNVTWQGKYREDFERFWDVFFDEDLTLFEISKRFYYIIDNIHVGPLESWFTWLRDKFICFVFISRDISIEELASNLHQSERDTSILLRSFFVEVFPQHEAYINENFTLNDILSGNRNVSANQLVSDLGVDLSFSGSHNHEILTSMEVTLYQEWIYFVKKMEKDFRGTNFNISRLKFRDNLSSKMQSLAQVFAFIGVAIFLVWAIEFANRTYEKYLSDKISVYEPQFRWENEGLKFTDETIADQEQIAQFELDIKDIENVDDTENFLGETLEDEERDEVESEVVLTSIDTLPRDISSADREQSSFEEDIKGGGYRDSRYGNTKVYRVMMNSADTDDTRKRLSKLLDLYQVTQVDNVKPGLAVPGGFYYNLYVPRSYLKEFMAQVKGDDSVIIYESRTRTRRNPPGKNKVFIWLKAI